MTDRGSEDRLRDLLRAGDPAADGSDLTTEESASMRRTVLNRLPERRPSRRWLPVAAGAATRVALAVWVGSTRPGDAPPATAKAPPELTVDDEAQTAAHHQQIQFATENGTRIIWVLNPDLTL